MRKTTKIYPGSRWLKTKDNFKKAIAEDSKKVNKMTDKQLEKYAYVFDRIQEILDAEKVR